MPEPDAPIPPAPDAAPAPGATPKDASGLDTRPKLHRVTSLAEIVEATGKSPPKPLPIVLQWFLPPCEALPQGDNIVLEMETRFSADPWRFGIRYMTEVQEQLKEKSVYEKGDARGKEGQEYLKNPYADIVALAREVVVKPTWLHNPDAVAKFVQAVPPGVFAEYRRKLMLAVPLDGDFFDDYQALTVPKVLQLSAYESASASGSRPGPATASEQSSSSPTSTTTGPAAPKTGEPA